MQTAGVVDAATFTALYDRHAGALLRYCTRRVGPDAAEDVVAATFLVAYERWQSFEPNRSEALPWLYGIATNLLRRHRRSEVRAYRASEPTRRGRAGKLPRFWPIRRWIPAMAAAAAAAVLIGTFAVLQPHHTGTPNANGSSPASAQPGPSVSPLDPESVPVNLPRADPLPLTAEGLTVGPGQLLYSQQFLGDTHLEQWSEPDGTIVIATQATEPNYVPGPRLIQSQPVEQRKRDADIQRAQFAANGPSLLLPTRQYLATDLPTSAGGLAAQLKKDLDLRRDGQMLEDITDWVYRVEPLLTPQARATLIAALDLQKDTRVDHQPRTFERRSVYVVEQRNSVRTAGLIVDVATGRIIGAYDTRTNTFQWDAAVSWTYAVVTR